MSSDFQLPSEAGAVPLPAQPTAAPLAPPTKAAADLRRAHLLVVDDEPINAKVIEKLLAGDGYERITCVESGRRALDLLARERADLVLLDVFLGDVNGIDVLKQLRACPGAAVPILIVSASSDSDLQRIALDLGAIGFITKPICQSQLLAQVEKGLRLPT